MKKISRIFLSPFGWLYGCIVFIRNFFYDYEILKSTSFDLPIISVGNLTVGGTGKTPLVEYLIRLLSEKYVLSTLSRGYKRKTKGFILAGKKDNASTIGDEPMQIKFKYPKTWVAVETNRVKGVQQLIQLDKAKKIDVIILDDAFQHRRIKPGLSILLIDYNRLPSEDTILPAGRLREHYSQKKRADIIIITKCPEQIMPVHQRILIKEIDAAPYQDVFFTSIEYEKICPVFSGSRKKAFIPDNVLLVAGIANPKKMLEFVNRKFKNVKMLKFPDHHDFKPSDLEKIRKEFYALPGKNKIVLTTEKDAVRIRNVKNNDVLSTMLKKIYYLPIKVRFQEKGGKHFNAKILKYVSNNRRKL